MRVCAVIYFFLITYSQCYMLLCESLFSTVHMVSEFHISIFLPACTVYGISYNKETPKHFTPVGFPLMDTLFIVKISLKLFLSLK